MLTDVRDPSDLQSPESDSATETISDEEREEPPAT
jgi:hypothetical protein